MVDQVNEDRDKVCGAAAAADRRPACNLVSLMDCVTADGYDGGSAQQRVSGFTNALA
jgi:hypothetical protein